MAEVQENCVTRACRTRGCESAKLILGSGVVLALVLVVFVGVAEGFAVLQIHAAANYVLLLGALTLLAYLEALHYAVVAVEKWNMTQYKERFPRAYKTHKLVDSPEKVKKFLVGRQFFTIFVVFLISQISSFPYIPHHWLGLPHGLVTVVLQIGLPGVALVLTFGQLISQIYVEEYTLQFLNLYGCEFVVRLSLGAEWIGVCNFSWLLYHASARLCCRSVRRAQAELEAKEAEEEAKMVLAAEEGKAEENQVDRSEEPAVLKSAGIRLGWFDIVKYIWSTFATLGSLLIIFYGISIQAYVLPTPVYATYIVFICTLAILFYLEGLMIAIVGTQYWDRESFRELYPNAYALHELINRPNNVKRFIIGRQFFTVLTNFLLGQITTMHTFPSEGYNSVLFYIIVKSGLVGVLVVLAFAQLCPELMAAEYPLRFMNMPGSYTIGAISLVFDACGVGHCAWSIYYVTRRLCCRKYVKDTQAAKETKPEVVRVVSAEIVAATQSRTKSAVNNSGGIVPPAPENIEKVAAITDNALVVSA